MSKQFENRAQEIKQEQLKQVAVGGEGMVQVQVGCELAPELKWMSETEARAMGYIK